MIGASVSKATARLKDAGFDAYVAGNVASSMAAGTVAYTDPAGSAFPGSKIGLYVSTGQPVYQVPDPQPTQPGQGQTGSPADATAQEGLGGARPVAARPRRVSDPTAPA